MYKSIKENTMLEKNGVFVIINCDNFNTNHNFKRKVLMSFRRDNTLGFIGGKVDEGETLIQALVREVKEEINFQMTTEYINNLKHLSSYKDKNFGIHTYILNVSVDEMLEIRKNSLNSTHGLDEMCGLCVVNIGDYKTNERLLSNTFSATAGIELIDFMTNHIK